MAKKIITNDQVNEICTLASVEGELTGMAHAVEMTKGDVVWERLAEALRENAEKLKKIRDRKVEEYT
jgi:hypothetical protein